MPSIIRINPSSLFSLKIFISSLFPFQCSFVSSYTFFLLAPFFSLFLNIFFFLYFVPHSSYNNISFIFFPLPFLSFFLYFFFCLYFAHLFSCAFFHHSSLFVSPFLRSPFVLLFSLVYLSIFSFICVSFYRLSFFPSSHLSSPFLWWSLVSHYFSSPDFQFSFPKMRPIALWFLELISHRSRDFFSPSNSLFNFQLPSPFFPQTVNFSYTSLSVRCFFYFFFLSSLYSSVSLLIFFPYLILLISLMFILPFLTFFSSSLSISLRSSSTLSMIFL